MEEGELKHEDARKFDDDDYDNDYDDDDEQENNEKKAREKLWILSGFEKCFQSH